MSFYESFGYWCFMTSGAITAIAGSVCSKDYIEFGTIFLLTMLILQNGIQFGILGNNNTITLYNTLTEVRHIEDTTSRSLLIFTASLVSYLSRNSRTMVFGLLSAVFTLLTLIKIVPLTDVGIMIEFVFKTLFRNIGTVFAIAAIIKTMAQESSIHNIEIFSIPIVDSKMNLKSLKH